MYRRESNQICIARAISLLILSLFLIAIPAIAWGLFEWRVASDNKPFIRLSALGTVAVALMTVVILMSGSLVVLFCLGVPAIGRMTRPWTVRGRCLLGVRHESRQRRQVRRP